MKRSILVLLTLFAAAAAPAAAATTEFKDYVTCLALDASGRLYAGASLNGNGIFTSADGGVTWQQTKMRYGVNAIAVSKTGTVLTFANGFGYSRYLFRLSNGGSTLDSISLSFTPSFITTGPGGMLYATTFNEGLYTSTDDGMHWTKMTSWILGQSLILPAIAVTKTNVIVLGTRQGVFRLKENGTKWDHGYIMGHDSVALRQILPSPNGKLYAGAWEGMWINAYEVFTSADTGKNWTLLKQLKFDLDAMAIDSVGTTFVGTKNGVYRIAANGDSTYLGPRDVTVNGLGVRALLSFSKDTLFAGVYGGVYRTCDGGATWELLHNGMLPDTAAGDYTSALPFGSVISCGVVDNQNTFIVGTDSAGVFRSVDGGKTWMQTTLNIANVTGVVLDSLAFLYASSLDGNVYVSADHGVTWTTTEVGGGQLAGRTVYTLSAFTGFYPINGDSSRMSVQHMVLAGTDRGAYKYNVDGGFGRWSSMSPLTSPVNAITTCGADVFAKTVDGDIHLSDGGWSGWTQKGRIAMASPALAADRRGMLYASGARGVFRSNDKGLTWVQKNEGIADTNLVSAAVDNAGNIFVGSRTHGDIYKSTDQGESWTTIATLNYPVRCLIMSMDGESLYAAAADRLFKTVLDPTAVADPGEHGTTAPRGFSLAQNYPNPFNPSTVIRYWLAAPSSVTLGIYDVLGREVMTLVDMGRQQAGAHSVTFDAAGLPGGVYFYRLHTASGAMTKKLLLLK